MGIRNHEDKSVESSDQTQHQPGLAEQYARLLEDHRIQSKILETSNRILQSGSVAGSLEETFETVIQICMEAIQGDTSVIELYDEAVDELVGVTTDYGPYNPDGYFRLPLSESSLSGLAFKERQTVAIDDVVNDKRVSQRIRQIFSARSGIAAPLMVDEKPIGVLLTMTKERQIQFLPRDIALMEGLAHVAALAVHHQMINKKKLLAEHRFQRLIELAPTGILLLDESLMIIESNLMVQRLVGYRESELSRKRFSELFTRYEEGLVFQERLSRAKHGEATRFDTHLLARDGREIPVDINLNRLSLAGENFYQAFIQDITQRKRAERDLYEEKERAETTLRSIGDGVITTDSKGYLQTLNPMALELLNCQDEKIIGRHFDEVLQLVDEFTRKPFDKFIEQCLKGSGVWDLANLVLVDGYGRDVPVEISAAPIFDLLQDILGVVVVIRDVGPAKKMAKEMAYLATHDVLTGLMNRREFERRLKSAIKLSVETGAEHVLCYFDLDRFKVVNDTCGHTAGDQLLVQLSQMLKEIVRASDTLARLGGDEFGLLLDNCPLEEGRRIADQVRQGIRDFRFLWGKRYFDLGASVGVTAITRNTSDVAKVLSTVDAACYAAKDAGKDCVQVFKVDTSDGVPRKDEINWVDEISAALAEDRFMLLAQKIVSLSGDMSEKRYEILLRMQARDGTLVLPKRFIPAAERFHLMKEIDCWVLQCSFETIASMAHNPQWKDACWTINLSGQSLSDEFVLKFIQEQVEKNRINPQQICLEITETAAVANFTRAIGFFKALRESGFHFALDDFGSGLSSFAYLKNIQVDYLKIDGGFVKDMDHCLEDRAMVEAINKIGHVMNLKTIAEYVESEAIARVLKQMGVDYAQGNYYGEPGPLFNLIGEL